jgi:chromosome segregation ATPase
MNSWMTRAACPLALTMTALLAGCGGISDLTRERVARSETSVQQAQQAVGNSEQGAIELQRAKENLDSARRAMKDGDEQLTERHAQLAQLDAELAVSKAQSASARKAANELLVSIKTLRQEAERSSGAPVNVDETRDEGRTTLDSTPDEPR